MKKCTHCNGAGYVCKTCKRDWVGCVRAQVTHRWRAEICEECRGRGEKVEQPRDVAA